jgi:hypothetical protein
MIDTCPIELAQHRIGRSGDVNGRNQMVSH